MWRCLLRRPPTMEPPSRCLIGVRSSPPTRSAWPMWNPISRARRGRDYGPSVLWSARRGRHVGGPRTVSEVVQGTPGARNHGFGTATGRGIGRIAGSRPDDGVFGRHYARDGQRRLAITVVVACGERSVSLLGSGKQTLG